MRIISAIMAICLLLCSCAAQNQNHEIPDFEYGDLGIVPNFGLILGLVDRNIYSYDCESDEFLRCDLTTGEFHKIGVSDGFNYSSNDNSALAGGNLYAHLAIGGVWGDDENPFEVSMYKINIGKDSVSKVSSELRRSPLVFARSKAGESLLSLTASMSDNLVTSWINEYSPRTGKTNMLAEKKYLEETGGSGERLVGFDYDANADKLYAFVSVNDNGVCTRKVEVYDGNGNLERVIDITESLKDVLSYIVATFYVSDSYMYMSNFSDASTLAFLGEDCAEPLVLGGYSEFVLDRAFDCGRRNEKYQCYFLRDKGKAQLLLFDSKESTIRYVNMPDPTYDARIGFVAVDGDEILIVVLTGEKQKTTYFYNINDLISDSDTIVKVGPDNVLKLGEQVAY